MCVFLFFFAVNPSRNCPLENMIQCLFQFFRGFKDHYDFNARPINISYVPLKEYDFDECTEKSTYK